MWENVEIVEAIKKHIRGGTWQRQELEAGCLVAPADSQRFSAQRRWQRPVVVTLPHGLGGQAAPRGAAAAAGFRHLDLDLVFISHWTVGKEEGLGGKRWVITGVLVWD